MFNKLLWTHNAIQAIAICLTSASIYVMYIHVLKSTEQSGYDERNSFSVPLLLSLNRNSLSQTISAL